MWQALTFQAGYNAALVALGAALLGAAAGGAGSFMVLRKRALISDALAHATLPGVALAFLALVALGGDGRSLLGLMAGSAATATLGLLFVDAITRRTRLGEDAAIGAVLSVFFGAGIVLLTVIQTLPTGRQAGLESFLLGSTAGMLRADALTIAGGAALVTLALVLLRRPLTLVAFDAGFARASGVPVRAVDLALMALVMGVTVVGLRIVGLVLIVALLIVPAVAARFWTERSGVMALIAAGLGALSGYLGAVFSTVLPDLPTGPMIVLIAAALFLGSLAFAPGRGVLAAVLRQRAFSKAVHRRQGLLAMARDEPIRDAFTLKVLGADDLIRPDGVATPRGQAEAIRAARDEALWAVARARHSDTGQTGRYDGLTPVEEVFTPDQIAHLAARLEGSA